MNRNMYFNWLLVRGIDKPKLKIKRIEDSTFHWNSGLRKKNSRWELAALTSGKKAVFTQSFLPILSFNLKTFIRSKTRILPSPLFQLWELNPFERNIYFIAKENTHIMANCNWKDVQRWTRASSFQLWNAINLRKLSSHSNSRYLLIIISFEQIQHTETVDIHKDIHKY